MGNRQQVNQRALLRIGILVLAAIIIAVLVWLGAGNVEPPTSPVSPVSPLAANSQPQAAIEEFDNLDGEGEIKWFDNFFTWNPKAQYSAYPFITGTLAVYWDDTDLGLEPPAIPAASAYLVVELLLYNDDVSYSQVLSYTDVIAPNVPGTGPFFNPTWVWIDCQPGIYNEAIYPYWQVGAEKVPINFVRNGQVVKPVDNMIVYREGLIIPDVIYLPIVAKDAR